MFSVAEISNLKLKTRKAAHLGMCAFLLFFKELVHAMNTWYLDLCTLTTVRRKGS